MFELLCFDNSITYIFYVSCACRAVSHIITKVMFILSSHSIGLELWSVNRSSIDENSELKVFKNIFLLGEISN